MSDQAVLKTAAEVGRLQRAAQLLHEVFAALPHQLKPGMSTADIQAVALTEMRSRSLSPALHGFQGYPESICVSVNNVAAHGLPGSTALRPGDLITVDISADLAGYKADSAWTYLLPPVSAAARRLVRIAWRVTMAGVAAARGGSRMGDLGAAVAAAARRNGCSVVTSFTGHGIGRELHEGPVVPNEGEPGTGTPIVPGMVLNIEPVVTLGSGEVTLLDDGWSYVTADGSLAAQFELTVAVRASGPQVLTLSALGGRWTPTQPPYG
jgi:methionyl aminopeptidase